VKSVEDVILCKTDSFCGVVQSKSCILAKTDTIQNEFAILNACGVNDIFQAVL